MSARAALVLLVAVLFVLVSRAGGAEPTGEALLGPNSGPGATDAASVEAAAKAVALVKSADFAGVEAYFAELRAKPRRDPSGASVLAAAYGALSDWFDRDEAARCAARPKWYTAVAKPATLVVVEALVSLARSERTPGDTTARAEAGIRPRGLKGLRESGDVRDDPHVWAVSLRLGAWLDLPEEDLADWFRRGLAVDPEYAPLHAARAFGVLRRGGVTALAPFAELEGGARYATVAAAALSYLGWDGFRAQRPFPWPRLLSVLGDLNRRHPGSSTNYDLTGVLAALADHRELARSAFARVAETGPAGPWGDPRYPALRAWARRAGAWPLEEGYVSAVAGAALTTAPVAAALRPLAAGIVIPEAPTGQEAAWIWNSTVGAYAKIGHHDEYWDREAVEGLVATARRWVDASGACDLAATRRALETAVSRGCQDGMVAYALASTLEAMGEAKSKENLKHCNNAAVRIRMSAYPASRRCVILRVAAQVWADSVPPGGAIPSSKIAAFLAAAREALPEAVLDTTVPLENRAQFVLSLVREQARHQGELPAMAQVAAALEAKAPDSTLTRTLKGALLVKQGFAARGTELASKVPAEAIRTMYRCLQEAEVLLAKAAGDEPTLGWAACEMLGVCLGLNKPRDEMERWFKRAVTASPDGPFCMPACGRKMIYLLPRWHGSREALLEFGRECMALARQGKGASYAEYLIRAHEDVDDDVAMRGGSGYEYWLDPAVWAEVKEAFEVMLGRGAGAGAAMNTLLTRYAYAACRSEQWAEAARLFDRIGDGYDRAVFEKRVYNREGLMLWQAGKTWRAQARQHAGLPPWGTTTAPPVR